jgi:hypothetical protein
MPADANAVEIVIRVSDANSAAVISSVTQNLDKLGAAGSASGSKMKVLVQEVSNLGQVAPPALRWTRQAVQEVGDHVQTSLDKVRLLRQELGIHVPRAMETLIAKNDMLMSGIAKLGGLMAGIGFGSIVVAFGAEALRGIDAVIDHYGGVEKAVENYVKEVKKSQNEEFGDTHSIETTRLRIEQAYDSMDKFDQRAADAKRTIVGWRSSLDLVAPGAGSMLESWHQQGNANNLEAKAIERRQQIDKLNQLTEGSQYHDERLQDITLGSALDDSRIAKMPSAAQARAKHDAQIREQSARSQEERRYANEQDRILGNPVAADAGAAKQKAENSIVQAKANAELFTAEKAQAEELRKLHEEAIDAGLKGTALIREQELAAERELKQQGMATPQAINDVRLKFHNEEMKRLQDENREVSRMREESALSGLTGPARVRQEGANKLADIYRNNAGLNPGQMLAEVKAVNDQTAQQIGELNKSFKDRVDEIVGQSANRELQGFARIREEAGNQIQQLQREYADKGGNPADLARGVNAINQGASGQAADLARRNEDETSQIETEARVRYLDSEKQKTAAIESEYEQRLEKYKEQLDAQEISQQDYNRRVAAAAQNANAEMVQAATEARQKMAGEFEQFFRGMDHPLRYLQTLGDKVAGQAAAAMVQRVQQHGSAGGSTGRTGGLFGGILGGLDLGGAVPPEIAAGGHPGFGSRVGQSSTMSVSSATIYVGSAMIAGLGAPASTGFHTAGVSGFSGGVSSGFSGGGSSAFSSGGGGAPGFSSMGSTASGFTMPSAAATGRTGAMPAIS